MRRMNSFEIALEYRIEFGRNVRIARKRQQLTQAELSQRSGLNRTVISRIESGHANTTIDTIVLLAVALDATPADLFAGIAPAPLAQKPLPPWL